MVLRDRNHPSVVMWSIGNEIGERGDPLGAQEAKKLADYVRGLDKTRPITSALNFVFGKWTDTDGYYSALDIGGYNYNLNNHVEDHKRVPSRVMACTESYARDTFDYWAMVIDFPYIVGDFVWTAIDYLGESGLGRWYYRDPKDTSRAPIAGTSCGIAGRSFTWAYGNPLPKARRCMPRGGVSGRSTRAGPGPAWRGRCSTWKPIPGAKRCASISTTSSSARSPQRARSGSRRTSECPMLRAY